MPRTDRAATDPATAPGQVADPAPGNGFRPDLQALRALAVILVVVYHLWPHRLTGGYVGVDVFFVISGFLITAHLWREAAVTGRVRLGRFWARRARRLLPLSLLVLATTAAAIITLVPSSAQRGDLTEVLASTFYVENWYLSAQSVDYLGAGQAASPVRHYWTLSVEEQFYVMLPLLIVGALMIAGRRGSSQRRVVLAVLGTVVAGAFVYGLWISAVSPSAYFSTFARLWEFGVGALVAIAVPHLRGRNWLAVLGVGLIVLSAVLFGSATPFPGYHALIPVLGTALVLVGGAGTMVERVGRWRPVAHLGRTSYAIYLWHWPLIVLVPFATAIPLDAPTKIAIAAATVLLASLSTLYVEEPVRFSSSLLAGRAPRVVAMWSVIGMAAVAAIVGIGIALADADAERERELAARAATELESGEADCAGAAALVSADECGDQEQDPEPEEEQEPEEAPVPEVFVPALADLEDDDANRAECWTGITGGEFAQCTIGELGPDGKRILVLGDSRSNALISAYERIAESADWEFDLAGRAGCYLTKRPLGRAGTDFREGCDSWREEALNAVAEGAVYDAVLVTRRQPPDLPETMVESEIDGLASAWQSVAPGVPVLALMDNPRIGDGFVGCLDREGPGGAEACAVPREEAVYADLARDAAAPVPDATVIDLTDSYCTDTVCPAVAGGIVMYRPDGHHVGATYALTLAPVLLEEMSAALRGDE